MKTATQIGRIVSINVSNGGVPKDSVETAEVRADGLAGDRQNDTKHHGGLERAVCVFAREIIERLRAEGHPIMPGSTGENLTVEGLDWTRVGPGARLRFEGGGVELEVTSYASPCRTIRDSFRDGEFTRILQKRHPGESRVYARVLREGQVRDGEAVVLEEAAGAED